MINIKTKEEVEIMRNGGRILAETLEKVLNFAKPGVSELELEKLADETIRKKGAEPAFKRVKGYYYAACIATNDVVVHGIPAHYKLKEGDVLGVDLGVYYKGFNTDGARTIRIQNSEFRRSSRGLSPEGIQHERDKVQKFLETGERALNEAIKLAKAGNRVGHISRKIQDIVEVAGYSIVRSLVGHGVGKELHEEPEVPGFLDKAIEKTPLLKTGMTIAIEVIYNMGESDVIYGDDGWTIKTKDGSLSGLFEKTVAITKNGPLVLT